MNIKRKLKTTLILKNHLRKFNINMDDFYEEKGKIFGKKKNNSVE